MRMWERSLNSIETRPISGTEGQVAANSSMFWSPDNQSIGFYADGAVKRISRDGGAPQVVCRVPNIAVGGTVALCGDIVVGTPSGLLRCRADGGAPSPLTDTSGLSGPTVDFFPTFLQDGQHLLFLRISRADPSSNGLHIADSNLTPAQQTVSRVVETGFGGEFVSGPGNRGTILFVRNGGLWAVPFLADRLAVAGEAVEIYSSVGTFRDSAFFRANQNTLVYRGAFPDYQLTWHSRSGDTLGVAGEPGQYLGLALSPDETMAAVARENRLNRFDQDLWLVDLRRNTTIRFTTDALLESIPAWSSDGQSLVYAGGQNGTSPVRGGCDGGTSRGAAPAIARPETTVPNAQLRPRSARAGTVDLLTVTDGHQNDATFRCLVVTAAGSREGHAADSGRARPNTCDGVAKGRLARVCFQRDRRQ